jgi:hypothetical protein
MSITTLFAIFILGCDFALYLLFKFLYGEKRFQRPAQPGPSHSDSRFAPEKTLTPEKNPARSLACGLLGSHR